jgi:hypothetical protein
MEGVTGAPAMDSRVGQPVDDLQLFDDGAWPSVIDDEWQRGLVPRPHRNEVDVEAVDLGDELR